MQTEMLMRTVTRQTRLENLFAASIQLLFPEKKLRIRKMEMGMRMTRCEGDRGETRPGPYPVQSRANGANLHTHFSFFPGSVCFLEVE